MKRIKKDRSARLSARISQRAKDHLILLANNSNKTETEVIEELILSKKMRSTVVTRVAPEL